MGAISTVSNHSQCKGNQPDISRGRPDEDLEPPFLGDPRPQRRVVVTHGIPIDPDPEVLGLVPLEEHLLEGDELLLRPGEPRLLVAHVQLHSLVPVHLSDVAHRDRQLERRAGLGEHLGAERGPPVLELRVGQAVAEGEQRRDVGPLVVPVPDVEALAVDDVEVLAGPVVVCRGVCDGLGEGALSEVVSN